MQVNEREALGQIWHYCWGCGRRDVLDAHTCMCSECDRKERDRIKALSAARRKRFPDKYDLGTGHIYTKADYERAA